MQDTSISGLWVLANISYAGMRAQDHANVLWRTLAFLFGLVELCRFMPSFAAQIAVALDADPQGYAAFDSGVAKKFGLDPHGLLKAN
jgi:hypothetical protein